jgi:DNA-binding response OmpR family regulator
MRILVVEDEPLIALVVKDALVRAGHEVLGPVASVGAALELVHDHSVDLALLDVNLGRGGNGIDLARRLHERHRIVSLFASASYREAYQASDVAMGLLSKPYGEPELVLAVDVAATVLAGGKATRVPNSLELF